MNRIEKGLGILMWVVVALMVIIFFATIMVGHATNFEFFYGLQETPEISKALVSTSNIKL